MCASGVIMCRMFLAIVPLTDKRSLNRDVFLLADLGAVTPRVADFDLNPRFALGTDASSEELRVVGVGCEGEASRPPGALADSMRPESLQSRGDSADRLAGEAAAALSGGEMITDDFLNPGDAYAGSLEIPFSAAGQDLHERAAADFARRRGGKRRQACESPRFRHAVRALN